MGLTKLPRVRFATDESMETITNTPGSAFRGALEALVAVIAANVMANDPTLIAAAVARVDQALLDASIVKNTAVSDRGAQFKFGVQSDGIPANDRIPENDRIPAKSTFELSRTFPSLDQNGQLPSSVMPKTEAGTDLTAQLELVSSRGRPAYAPAAGSFDPVLGLFNYKAAQMHPWLLAREKARRGVGQARILVLSDSTARTAGDLQAGETFPKDAWPGQMLDRLGLPIGGTGIRIAAADIDLGSHVGGFAEPTITLVNPNTATNKIERLSLGFAQSSFWNIIADGSKGCYAEFNTAAGSYTELWLFGGEIAGTSVVTIDGVDRTWAGSTSVAGADIPCLPGYASGQRISRIALPAGTHVVQVHGTPGGVPFGAFEGRNTSGVILHRGAISGKSQYGFMLNTGNLDGLPWAIDPWGAHLVIEALHINDWQGHRDVAQFIEQKKEIWSRARSRGAAVLSVIAPTPDLTMYPASGGNVPPITEYIAAFYTAALASDVPVLDLSYRWGGYAPAAGFYSAVTDPPEKVDHIHPNSLGASDIAGVATKVLLS